MLWRIAGVGAGLGIAASSGKRRCAFEPSEDGYDLRDPLRLRRLIPSGRSARGGWVGQVLGPEDVLEAMKEAQLLPFRCLSTRPVSRPTRTHARARAAHALTGMGMAEREGEGGGRGRRGEG